MVKNAYLLDTNCLTDFSTFPEKLNLAPRVYFSASSLLKKALEAQSDREFATIRMAVSYLMKWEVNPILNSPDQQIKDSFGILTETPWLAKTKLQDIMSLIKSTTFQEFRNNSILAGVDILSLGFGAEEAFFNAHLA